jgi:hypothetical protein
LLVNSRPCQKEEKVRRCADKMAARLVARFGMCSARATLSSFGTLKGAAHTRVRSLSSSGLALASLHLHYIIKIALVQD